MKEKEEIMKKESEEKIKGYNYFFFKLLLIFFLSLWIRYLILVLL